MLRLAPLVIALGLSAGCQTEPDCIDPHGRTAGPYQLSVYCNAEDDGLSCRSSRYSASPYGCTTGIIGDVTNDTTWKSSDSAIATFVIPGHLRVQSAGQAEITVSYADTIPLNYRLVFAFVPGTPAEQLARFSVFTKLASGAGVSDVALDLFPERGQPQSCVTNASGSCEFWIFKSRVRAVGSKPGFQTSEGVKEPTWPGFVTSLTVTMIPQ